MIGSQCWFGGFVQWCRGFVEENSGAGGLGIFITHSLVAGGIEAQYQRKNQAQFILGSASIVPVHY